MNFNLKSLFLGALIMISLMFTGCATEQLESGPPPAVNEFSDDKSYQIGVGDQISVQVWRNEELSLNVPVRPDGKISAPLVGDIQAAGMTSEGLSKDIAEKLSNFVRNPEVTVIVTNPVSGDYLRRVRMTGAVRGPVSSPYRQGVTILDLVLEAGGLTEFAAANKAKLYRKVDGKTKIYPVRLKDILESGDLSTNYTLYPSDLVTVPERNF